VSVTIERVPRVSHACDLPAPDLRMGTIVRCDECGRRWKIYAVGWSFKNWRRTFGTGVRDLWRGPGVSKYNWASVYRNQHDRRRLNVFGSPSE
jgi:hypothetical protein